VTRQLSPADAALDRLIAEFGDRLPVGSIMKAFAQSVRGLRLAGVQAGLLVAAEAMTRNRLTARFPREADAGRLTA
jgi:hypothetical protein